MVARSYASAEQYRYGYNGQEKDDDILAGLLGAEYWEYDSRLGRRWNIDPKSNPAINDYAFFFEFGNVQFLPNHLARRGSAFSVNHQVP